MWMIAWLSDLTPRARKKYGSKAVTLGRLLNAGHPVPEGFGISADFFMEYLDFNRIKTGPSYDFVRHERISQSILQGDFTPAQQRLLREYAEQLGGPHYGRPVAVRSSCLTEDTRQVSFAGVFESVTEITGWSAIEKAVKEVYASLFSERALCAAHQHDINITNWKMPVLIQTCIEGTWSGVIFTADPVHGNPAVLVVAAIDGSCRDYMNARTAVKQFEIPKEELARNKLPANLRDLAAAALAIEQGLGYYQDIEWTFQGNKLWILQSRDLSVFKHKQFSLGRQRGKIKRLRWQGGDGPFKPLFIEIKKEINKAGNRGALAAGLKHKYQKLLIVNGYSYYRVIEIPNAAESSRDFERSLEELKKTGKNIYTDVCRPRLLKIHRHLGRYLKKKLSPGQLVKFLKASFQAVGDIWYYHWIAVKGCLDERILRKLRRLWHLTTYELYDLLYAPSIMVKQRKQILVMACTVKKDSRLTAIFSQHTCDKLVYEKAVHISPVFRRLANRYLKDCGLHKVWWDGEALLQERAESIINEIRLGLNADFQTIKKAHKQRTRVRKMILKKVLALNADDGQTKRLVRYYRKAFLVRDNHNVLIDALFSSYYLLAARWAGELLDKRRQLAAAADVKYLFFAEIVAALQNNPGNLKPLVAHRQKLWLTQRGLSAPHRMGPAAAKKHQSTVGHANTRTSRPALSGYSGLERKVTGSVKVIKDGEPPLDYGIKYIYVCPDIRAIDPVAFHASARGFVFDNGSPFDHSGIWARENGIPALYGTKHAAAWLKDGDEVCLDGVKEKIVLIKKAI